MFIIFPKHDSHKLRLTVFFPLTSICRTVSMKDINNGKLSIIYNAKEMLSGLKTPTVKDPKVSNSNSALQFFAHVVLST